MKRLLIILSVAFIASFAQSQNIKIGPCFGGNYSLYDYNDWKFYNVPIGFNIGVISDIPIGKSFSFSPEINFEQRNTSSKNEELNLYSSQKYSFISVNAPVKYYIGGNKQFFGYIGPYYSYLLKWEWNLDGTIIDLTKSAMRNTVGFIVGAGFLQPLTNNIDLMIDANYGQSLFFIGNSENEDEGVYKAVRLNIGVLFTINK